MASGAGDGATTANVLVRSPPETSVGLVDALAGRAPETTKVIAVLDGERSDAWLRRWEAAADELPSRVGLIDVEESSADALPRRKDAETHPDGVSVTTVGTAEPASVVHAVDDYLREWDGDGGRTVVSLPDLGAFLDATDVETVLRYVDVLTNRVREVGAVGYYRIDAAEHPRESVEPLASFFDATVGADAASPPTDGASPADEVRRTFASAWSVSPDATGSVAGGSTAATNAVVSGTDSPAVDAAPRSLPALSEADGLSHEDRIFHLLIQRNGRMRQADIATETDLSTSSVSRKLSNIEDRGLITRIQLGQGKVVFLRGCEPDSALVG